MPNTEREQLVDKRFAGLPYRDKVSNLSNVAASPWPATMSFGGAKLILK